MFIVHGGSDAGGWQLVPDGHGGFKIVKVPGWQPEQIREITAALEAVSAVTRVEGRLSSAVASTAGKFAAEQMRSYFQKAMPDGQGNAPIVVVLANH